MKSVNYSKEMTGVTEIPANPDRSGFKVTMVDQAGTIELGGGGGKLPIEAGGTFEPLACPTSEMVVESTGEYVVVTVPPLVVSETDVQPAPVKYRYIMRGAQYIELPLPRDSVTFDVEFKYRADVSGRAHALFGGHYSSSAYVRMHESDPNILVLFAPKTGGGSVIGNAVFATNLQDGQEHTYRIQRLSATEFKFTVDGEVVDVTLVNASGVSFARALWVGASFGGGTGRNCIGSFRDFKLTTEHETWDMPIDDGWKANQVIQASAVPDTQVWDKGDVVADGSVSSQYGTIVREDSAKINVGATYRIRAKFDMQVGRLQILVGNTGPATTAGPAQGELQELRVAATQVYRVRQLVQNSEGTLSDIDIAETRNGLANNFIEADWEVLP